MKFGLPFRTRKAPTPAPRRRPTPDEQCTEVAASTGRQCSNFALVDRRCKKHPPPKPSPPAALTASVGVVQMDAVSWQPFKFGSRAWQFEAWRMYDITGQLRFVANWIGNSVSRCRLYVAEVGPDGEPGEEVTDENIAQLASGPLGSGPAKDEALRLLGLNGFVPGECFIIAESGDAGDSGDDRWFVVTGRHIHRSGNMITIRRPILNGGGIMTYREGIDLILRVWTPHPDDTDEPDSPTRSAIPDLLELEAIRKRIFAELDSRLAGAGIVLVPDSIDFARAADDPPGVNGFSLMLQRVMGTSMRDRSSAEAVVPIVASVDAELIDKIKHLTFWSELSAELLPLREAAINSLAQALDIPPEVLLGQGKSSNHWTAWQTSEDAVKTQIVPVLDRIADALTTGYLRSALEQMGYDPDKYAYAFDTAPLTAKPNRTADALDMHKEGILSDQAAVEAGAWSEEDMPSQEERLRRFVEANPTLISEQWARDLLGITAPAPPPVPAIAPAPAPTEPPPAEKAPETPPEQPAQPPEAAAIIAVADLAMLRALALAGGRLIPHRQRDRYAGTGRHQLHTRFGAITRDRAETELRGAWADLPTVAVNLNIDPVAFEALLNDFAIELLTRGMAYDYALLQELIVAAVRGRRLQALAGVSA